MNILIVNKYQNTVNRGAETFVSELSKRLSKNHEVEVSTKINFFKKYNVVIPTNGRLQVFVTRVYTWLTGSKMVVSGQSGVGLDDRLNLYAFPDVFVALTDFAAKESKKRNPFLRIEKITNGVDLNRFSIQRSKPKNKVRTVLAVGAFTKEKRHDLVIKAVSKLNNCKLIVVGGGGPLKEEITDLGLKVLGKDRFELIQTINDKMPEIYRSADLFTFPTVPWESFGIVLVEAMASGLPVVATDDPIRHEIVGDAGIFVDPTDIDAYAKAIEEALSIDWNDKQSLAKLGLGKPRKQAEKFDWDKIAKQYEELFNNL